MLPAVLPVLRCPICHASLVPADHGGLRCAERHTFNAARQGYLDLTAGPVRHPGDAPEMVAARAALLDAGHLDAVSTALLAAIPERARGTALDAGAGTGHHLARVLAARPGLTGIAVDVAKPALRRAARAHPRIVAVRADIWRHLPIADRAVALVLNVFAPRSAGEFHRVLRPDGRLIVVTPAPDHLAELAAPLHLIAVDPAKRDRLATTLGEWFEQVGEAAASTRLALSRTQAAQLVLMGPSARHLDPPAVSAGLASLPQPVAVSISVEVTTWQPR